MLVAQAVHLTPVNVPAGAVKARWDVREVVAAAVVVAAEGVAAGVVEVVAAADGTIRARRAGGETGPLFA